MRNGLEQRARRPVSYDTEPCEGRQASPSNPSNGRSARASSGDDAHHGGKAPGLDACVVFRCTAHEKALLLAKADSAGMRISTLMREALGLVDARRRRPMPTADPAMLREAGRIGGNLNQIARWLNTATALGLTHEIDALVVAAELVSIERALSAISTKSSRDISEQEQPPC